MADIFINDDALDVFNVADAGDLYTLWIDSVRLVSRTSKLTFSETDVVMLCTRSSVEDHQQAANTLVELGFWLRTADGWALAVNEFWALNEPDGYAGDLAELQALRPCPACPELTDTTAVLVARFAAANQRTVIEAVNELWDVLHRDHANPN